MKIIVRGDSHLAETHTRASMMRGWAVNDFGAPAADLMLCAQDVLSHEDLDRARWWFDGGVELIEAHKGRDIPLVLLSQVPPGTTRKWAGGRTNIFYQVDTIIMRNALRCVLVPAQIIVGCADPQASLPLAYQEYLVAHECPVLQVTYEEAELAKLAINYMLAKQIEVANELAEVARKVGADYQAVRQVMQGDSRIGEYAYLVPGKTNQHLERDVLTIRTLKNRDDQSWRGFI